MMITLEEILKNIMRINTPEAELFDDVVTAWGDFQMHKEKRYNSVDKIYVNSNHVNAEFQNGDFQTYIEVDKSSQGKDLYYSYCRHIDSPYILYRKELQR